MAVRVVRAMLMITLHLLTVGLPPSRLGKNRASSFLLSLLRLFFDSLVIVVIFLDFLRDVAVYAKDASAVDEDLGEDVEDTVVDFAGWWEHEGDECHDDATGEKDDGGQFLVVWIPVE